MIGREHDRSVELPQVLEPARPGPRRTRARSAGSRLPGWRGGSSRTGARRFQRGEVDRLVDGGLGRAGSRAATSARRASRASANFVSSRRVWNRSSSATISSTRSSELRPSASSVVVAGDGASGGETREHGLRAIAAALARRRALRRRRPSSRDRRAFQLARALGARQRSAGPHRHAANPLVVRQRALAAAHHRVCGSCRARAPARRARARSSCRHRDAPPPPTRSTPAHALQHPLDIVREDVEALRA